MKKQPNSQMCFACGIENPIGLKLGFYETDAGQVLCRYTPCEDHQGYPDVLHGGIVLTVLDEVTSRACIAAVGWVLTAKMEVRYRQPVPLGQPLLAVGEIVDQRKRRLVAHGELRLPDGTVGAEATGTFIRMSAEQSAGMADMMAYWRVVPDEDGMPAFDDWAGE